MKNKLSTVIGGLLVGAGGAAFTEAANAAGSSASETISTKVGSSIGITVDPTLALWKDGVLNSEGLPGDTVSGTNTVTVTTNNKNGYTVTVGAQSANMTGTSGNTDTIPVSSVAWKNTTTTPAWPATPSTLSTTAQSFATKAVKPATSAGDVFNTDFKLVLPNVQGDTYSVNVNYVATTTA